MNKISYQLNESANRKYQENKMNHGTEKNQQGKMKRIDHLFQVVYFL